MHYYLPSPQGTRTGPYTSREISTLLENGELDPDDSLLLENGTTTRAGTVLHVVTAERRAWKPAPFPAEPPTALPPEKKSPPPETCLWASHPSYLHYWRSIFAALTLFCAGSLTSEAWPPAYAIGLLGSSLLLLTTALRRQRRLYLISNKRAEIITGLISKSTREIRIQDIKAVQVERHGLEGLLGVCDLILSASSGSEDDLHFNKIRKGRKVRNLIRRHQEPT